MSHGRTRHFSRDTSKTQPVVGGERMINSRVLWGIPNLCLLYCHVVSCPGDYENSECLNITSCPPGTPVEEICSFSYLAEFPNLGLELATQAAGMWWTLKLNFWIIGNQLIPTQYWPVLTGSPSLGLHYRPHAAVISCLLKRNSLCPSVTDPSAFSSQCCVTPMPFTYPGAGPGHISTDST